MMRIITIFSTIIVFASCGRSIFQYKLEDSIETIELKNDNTFIFDSKDNNNHFEIRGDYRLKDSNYIEFMFNPVDKEDLQFLPINEAEVSINRILNESSKGGQFLYEMIILENSLHEPIWGMNVNAFSDNKLLISKQTNREGKVTFESSFPIDRLVLQCENCVPTVIKLNKEDSFLIKVVWEHKGGRYGRGHMIPDRGPIKLMKVQLKNGKIIRILQNDLSGKEFKKK